MRWKQSRDAYQDPVVFLKSTKKVLKNMLYELSVSREVIIQMSGYTHCAWFL